MANNFIPLRYEYSGGSSPTGWAEYQTGETMALPGSLQFTGNGRKLVGDFSSGVGSLANRTFFQTSTVNGQTMVPIIPNGTSAISGFQLFSSADVENSPLGVFQNNGSSILLLAAATGAGAQLPLVLGTSGADRVSIGSTGGVQLSTPFRFPPYTLATLPSAAAYSGHCIEVSNAAGGAKICRSNGSVWQVINTTTTVS
ncbi:hypothetical protein ACKI1H_29095 [Pseudomonas sp. YH-1]|uniref:hypothetical protein n=1 Tax=Pseudomonas sp. YH-1 TaxID=3384787 RepID=UPI003F823324